MDNNYMFIPRARITAPMQFTEFGARFESPLTANSAKLTPGQQEIQCQIDDLAHDHAIRVARLHEDYRSRLQELEVSYMQDVARLTAKIEAPVPAVKPS